MVISGALAEMFEVLTMKRKCKYSGPKYYLRLMNRCAKPGEQYKPTDVEHLANIISHGVWILPSVLALVYMINISANLLQMIATLVYGSALVLLFTTSTIFHMLSYTTKHPKWRRNLHISDRAVIYLFIAASYTPWLILKEFNSWSEEVFCTVWIFAFIGVAYVCTYHERHKILEIIFYLSIGLFPAVCIIDMKDWSGLAEVTIGGSMYICGIAFFKCDGVIPFAHAIWHCFVFVGAFCHFLAITTYLLGSHHKDAVDT